MLARRLAQVIGHPEETDLTGRDQVFFKYGVVVVADLSGGGSLVQPRVATDLVDRVVTEHSGVDAVERRRLMESHKRIGVVPMAAGAVPSA